ncbi:MAG: endonuclease V [Bacteroidota bacterium]
MIVAIDVHYRKETAKIVAVLFNHWTDIQATDFLIKYMPIAADYEPGEFYKRELPCLLHILGDINLTLVECIVVDGYVFLDDDLKKGLGAHLFDALQGKKPVVGLAKSSFKKCKQYSREVLRGSSSKPLYVTAVGTELDEAVDCIRQMHGDFRIPTLLQQMDSKTKEP